jgi:hypothetical protein
MRRPVLLAGLAAFFAVALSPSPVHAQSTALASWDIIARDVGTDALSVEDVRAIFRGELALWPTREAVIVVLPSRRAEYASAFAVDVAGMRREAMQRFWLGLVFQGRASPPVDVASVGEAIAFVEETPGAIAAVPKGFGPRELLITVR